MKPTRNKHFCNGCGRTKMLFESQSKADNFIKFNGEDILEETGRKPVRSYYCDFCGGYHVTSSDSSEVGERIDRRDHHVMDKAVLWGRSKTDYKQHSNALRQKLDQARNLIINWEQKEAQEKLLICFPELEKLKKMHPLQIGKLMVIQHKMDVIQNVLNRWDELNYLSDEEIEEMINKNGTTMEEKLIVSMLKNRREKEG